MLIKKYPQSHLVISKEGKKICIDPGNFTFQKDFKTEDFLDIDAFLITHKHDDHIGEDTIKKLVGDRPVYANSDVIKKLKDLGVEGIEIQDGDEFVVEGFKIKAYDLLHFRVPDSKETPQNTGFVIDGEFFHAGDGFNLDGLTVDNAALPLGHASLSMLSVLDFAKKLNSKVLVPIHFDAYKRDPNELKKTSEYYSYGIKVIPLQNGEETEI